jgi:hypothetical protein
VQGHRVFPQKLASLAPGTRVFRNHDHAFAAEIARSRPSRKIGVDLVLHETVTGIALVAVDEDGVKATAELACAKIAAEKPDQANADMAARLAKLGDSEFTAKHLTLAWSRPLHLAAREVNGLRRLLAERLAQARSQARPVERRQLVPNGAPYPATKLDFRDNVLNAKARAFYHRHQVTDIEPAAESGLPMPGRTVMTCRYCLKYELGQCPREPRSRAQPIGAEPWYLVDDEGRKLRLRFRCEIPACVMVIIFEGIP